MNADDWGEHAKLIAKQHAEQVLLIGPVPHSWLFPRCAAVVHHGGAGALPSHRLQHAFGGGKLQLLLCMLLDGALRMVSSLAPPMCCLHRIVGSAQRTLLNAGTTGAGLAAGRPTAVLPAFADQAFWPVFVK